MADGKKAKKGDAKPTGDPKRKGEPKQKGEPKPKGDKRKAKTGANRGADPMTWLVDHPLVSDLLAVGAMAAVAAIAEQGRAFKTGAKAADGSRRAVKAAGKAAAAAIGQRLLIEVGGLGAGAKKKA